MKARTTKVIIISLLASSLITSSRTYAKTIKIDLGKVKISAYCAETNTPKNSRATSTGHTARGNHTIAVDMYDPIVPIGATVMIEGDDTLYKAEDVGNLHKYGRELDKFVESYSKMEKWGVRSKHIYLVREETKSEIKAREKEERRKEEQKQKAEDEQRKKAEESRKLLTPSSKQAETVIIYDGNPLKMNNASNYHNIIKAANKNIYDFHNIENIIHPKKNKKPVMIGGDLLWVEVTD